MRFAFPREGYAKTKTGACCQWSECHRWMFTATCRGCRSQGTGLGRDYALKWNGSEPHEERMDENFRTATFSLLLMRTSMRRTKKTLQRWGRTRLVFTQIHEALLALTTCAETRWSLQYRR